MPIGGSLRVVLNSSPIIVLAKLGLLESAVGLFTEVEVPRAVLEEVGKKQDEVYRKLIGLVEANSIRVEQVDRRIPRLGAGEAEAILLALSRNKIVVLDDKKARRLARELGLEVVGTLSLLKLLYEHKLLGRALDELYHQLIETGFYIEPSIFNKVFRNTPERF